MSEFHVLAGAREAVARPEVRSITLGDIPDVLRRGLQDFRAKPSHYIFVALIYPVVGVLLANWTATGNAFQLLYPLASGFALLGPIAAIGLYEISRRRESGQRADLADAIAVWRSPALPSILAVGAMLVALFIVWLFAAQALYVATLGSEAPASLAQFLTVLFGTSEGWTLILVGNAVGFVFAAIALATTVVAFPLLLDRDVGAVAAIRTSFRAVAANPVPMAAWGLVVALALVIGSLPLFAGLAVVLPILGHATWHLYRKVVAPA